MTLSTVDQTSGFVHLDEPSGTSSTPALRRDEPRDVRLLWETLSVSAVVIAASAVASQVMSLEGAEHFVSEAGLLEQISLPLWFVVAAVCLRTIHSGARTSIAGAGLALFAAAREASLHSAFGPASALKLSFYIKPEIALSQRALAAAFVLLMTLCALTVGWQLWCALRADRRWLAAWRICTAVAVGTLVVTKILDRAPGLLRNHAEIQLEPRVHLLTLALEESGEMMLPILVIVAIVLHRRSRRAADQPPNASS